MSRYKIFAKLSIGQYDQLIKNGFTDESNRDHKPVIKLFIPGTGCTWLLTEIDPTDTNLAFGLCDLGMGFPELGYVDLDELGQTFTSFQINVERDIYFEGKYPISVYAEAARSIQMITEDEVHLKAAATKLRKHTPQ